MINSKVFGVEKSRVKIFECSVQGDKNEDTVFRQREK